jgi:hypothetical protein
LNSETSDSDEKQDSLDYTSRYINDRSVVVKPNYRRSNMKSTSVNNLLKDFKKIQEHSYHGLSMTDLWGHHFNNPKDVETYLHDLYKWYRKGRMYSECDQLIMTLHQELRDELTRANSTSGFVHSVKKYEDKHHSKYWYIWLIMLVTYIIRAVFEFLTE